MLDKFLTDENVKVNDEITSTFWESCINFEYFYTSWTKNMIFDPLSKEKFDKGSPYISFFPPEWLKKKAFTSNSFFWGQFWSRFELTTSVVIGTDCIDSSKSNYHMTHRD